MRAVRLLRPRGRARRSPALGPDDRRALAALGCAVLALPLAWLLFRLRGGYFAIATWVVADSVQLAISRFPSLGGGTGAIDGRGLDEGAAEQPRADHVDGSHQLRPAADPRVVGIVITGTGRAFSAGLDMGDLDFGQAQARADELRP